MKLVKISKLNRAMILLVLCVVLACTAFCVSCNEKPEEEKKSCVEHLFQKVDDEINRAPTYDREGRELKKCSVCGLTVSFVIPKLERLSATEDPAYIPLLESYVVNSGDTLEEIASAYFTSGWAFVLEGETVVTGPSEEGYDYAVIYTSSEDKYSNLQTTIKLIVI